MKHQIYPGGMFRCCIKTLEERDDSKDNNGKVVVCPHCNAELILKDGHWQWKDTSKNNLGV